MKEIKLSPSTLNLLQECPRCFWLSLNQGISRPRGPMPSIAIGLDSAITRYFNYYRQKRELPSVLKKEIKARLVNEELFDFRKGIKAKWLVYQAGNLPVVLMGKLDDCLIFEDGYSPLDYKTRSSIPEEVHPAYKLQMDIYTFLLRENKSQRFPVNNRGYLLYFCPRFLQEGEFAELIDMESSLPFHIGLKPINTEPDIVPGLLKKAAEVVSLDTMPEASPKCEYCAWVEHRQKIADNKALSVSEVGQLGVEPAGAGQKPVKEEENPAFKNGNLF